MSGSRGAITPSWLSGSLRTVLCISSVYFCHVLLTYSASVMSILFLSFFVPIFAWNVPLVSLIFLKRSLVFPILLFRQIDRVPEELWTEVHNIVQEAEIKTIPKENKCKKAKRLSEETLQIAEKRREVKGKGEKERYTHLNAEFQRTARRDKKVFLGEQCKEIEENNRMGKAKNHAKMQILMLAFSWAQSFHHGEIEWERENGEAINKKILTTSDRWFL